MPIMAKTELYNFLLGDFSTRDFTLQTFPWQADLRRSDKWAGKPNQEAELPWCNVWVVKNCFPKGSCRNRREREKVDKDDRNMALYKERLNRLELFCLRKKWFKRFMDIEWNKEGKWKITILYFFFYTS